MLTCLFRVAGHTFEVGLPDGTDVPSLLPSYAPFVQHEASGALLFALTVDESLDLSVEGYDEIGQFDCGGANHGVWHKRGEYLFHISDVGGSLTGVLRVSDSFCEGRIRLFGTTAQRAFALNNALMILFAFAAAPRGTVLMHASVVMNAGRGFLFLGRSGTGKSTHARLWLSHVEGSDLLNDDNPAVRIMDGTPVVFGTPWSGKTPCYRNLSVPVGAITRLEQWPANAIRRETPVAAFASILSSCSTMVWDKPTYDAICTTVGDFVKLIPAFHLRCLPDEAAAHLCHDTLTCRA